MKKLIVGIAISLLCIYLLLRDIDLKQAFIGISTVNYFYLSPAVLLFILVQVLRSYRWNIILSPLEKMGLKRIFPISSIGFMAIAIFPLRIGELVRPYLVSQRSSISFSSALATIFIERTLDIFIIIALLILVVINAPFPEWIVNSAYVFLVGFCMLLSTIILSYFKTDFVLRILNFVLVKLSYSLRLRIENTMRLFLKGFRVIAKPRELIYALILSIGIWIFSGLAIYSLFCSSNLNLPLISAFFVLVITIIGVSLPSAPGFLGNFQFACVLALSVYSVSKSEAVVFSIIYYILGMGINILLGLVFIPFVKFSFSDIKKVSMSNQ